MGVSAEGPPQGGSGAEGVHPDLVRRGCGGEWSMRLAWPSILGGVPTGAQVGGGVPNYERGHGREAALRVCKQRFLTC